MRCCKELGEPLRPSELVKRLMARGFTSNAKKPHDSMRTALLRDSRFCQAIHPTGAWGRVEWMLGRAEEPAYSK